MITVFSCTNRKDSNTKKVAEIVYNFFLEQTDEKVNFFSLDNLPSDIHHVDMYGAENQSPELVKIQDEFLIPADKFYFVIPEYNGSFPGILKLFLDACSVRKYKESFHGGKKAALLGIASGRAGNLRGLEHFCGVLNYLQISVMPPHQPIGKIESILESGKITDQETVKAIDNQIKRFLVY
jgi:chromate reductase